MSTIFNSLDKNYKYPTGPVPKNEILTLRIKLPKTLNPTDVQFIIYEYCASWNHFSFPLSYEKSDENNIYFMANISGIEVNIYNYFFSFMSYGKRKYLKMCEDSWEAFISDQSINRDWQLTVYEPMKIHPNMQNGIMYQIFPDRFYNSGKNTNLPSDRIYRNWGELPYYTDDKIGKDFFGGDLNGVYEKIDYLAKLNVSVLYFNPIFESQSNHHYDTGSYEKVDPVLGNIDDLKKLIEKAHSHGMIVILDLVLNHTGSDSIYFNKYNRYPNKGAYNGKDSNFYNWYYFHYDNRDHYESWWGFDTLPKVNQHNSDFIEYFFGIGGIIDKLYALGIDGFRLDVADELENSTLEKIYEASARNRSSISITGEVWDNASNKCNYGHRMNYFLGHELTSVMNYPVKNALLSYVRYGNNWAYNLKRTLLSIFVEDYPKEIAHSLMNFLSSHDTVRAITKLAGDEVDNHDKNWQEAHDELSHDKYLLGQKRLMLSYLLMYFFPGIPSIFYGDEIGLAGQKDPFCRKCFTWDHIDEELLHFMRCLGNARTSISNFLASASFDVCEIDDSKCIYCRYSKDKILFVFANRSDSDISIEIPDYISNYILKNSSNLFFNGFHKKGIDTNSHNYKVLFSLGKTSNIYSIDAFGAVVVEVNYN